jgi:hypothetical protein
MACIPKVTSKYPSLVIPGYMYSAKGEPLTHKSITTASQRRQRAIENERNDQGTGDVTAYEPEDGEDEDADADEEEEASLRDNGSTQNWMTEGKVLESVKIGQYISDK